MSWELLIAIVANIMTILIGLLTLHHWQQSSRLAQDLKHEENRDLLHAIKDDLVQMRSRVEILWAWFRSRSSGREIE